MQVTSHIIANNVAGTARSYGGQLFFTLSQGNSIVTLWATAGSAP